MKYEIILADCPWPYYGSKVKDAAAGKHYDLMSLDDIAKIPVREMAEKRAALFLWATCPRLPDAIDTIRAWGWHYRGVAFAWCKVRKSDGALIHGQGVPPTFTKPSMELLLVATTMKTGRAFPLLDLAMPQVVLAPRGAQRGEAGHFSHADHRPARRSTSRRIVCQATGRRLGR